MLDIKLIMEKPEKVKKALLKRMNHVDFTDLIRWEGKRKYLIFESESLKAEKNTVSSEIPRLKKEGKPFQDLIERMRTASEKIRELDKNLSETATKIRNILEGLPNIPDDDVASGGKENNKTIRTWGKT